MYLEADPKQNQKGIKGLDMLMYLFQLLDCSRSRVGLHVAVGARDKIGGSVEFSSCDYEIVATTEVILVNESCLQRYCISVINCSSLYLCCLAVYLSGARQRVHILKET